MFFHAPTEDKYFGRKIFAIGSKVSLRQLTILID